MEINVPVFRKEFLFIKWLYLWIKLFKRIRRIYVATEKLLLSNKTHLEIHTKRIFLISDTVENFVRKCSLNILTPSLYSFLHIIHIITHCLISIGRPPIKLFLLQKMFSVQALNSILPSLSHSTGVPAPGF